MSVNQFQQQQEYLKHYRTHLLFEQVSLSVIGLVIGVIDRDHNRTLPFIYIHWYLGSETP